jgi:error-prone DNA polymerase
MFDGYVELHCHSAYSFLDGASMPDELVPRALELGHTALALTDHNGVYGSMEHAQVARSLGLKAIHGAELDLDDGRHLTLLVESSHGWTSLCRLITHAHAHTRAPDGGPIRDTPRVTLEQVLGHADGLVCLSGCATRGVHDMRSLGRLREVFGPDRLRIELQRPFLRNDRGRNRALEALAKRLGVDTVATGDVHAHDRSRALLQDAFVAIREHTTLDASEPLRRGNHAHVLSSPAAMAARFGDHPDAVAETARLAERLNFDLCEDLGYRYPGSEDATAPGRLAELCAARLDERYPIGHRHRSAALRRTEEELDLINRLDLAGFFLLHHDLLELAREVAVEVRGTDTARALLPPGRGRGSSVSSIVCYLTGLSHVDPIENELLLGRFLNDEITALPDIDLDFPRDVREVLLPRVHERYGRERSALVAAFPTYRSRGAIRELGKALGLPPGEIERVARGSEGLAKDVEGDIAAAYGSEKTTGGRWGWGCSPPSSAASRRSRARATSASICPAFPTTTPRPTPRSRRPTRSGSSRSRAGPKWPRYAEPARRRSTISRSKLQSCAPARSRAARSTRTSPGCSACAPIRPSRSPTTTRAWSRCSRTRSARSSSRTRSSRWRWRSPALARARPKGCGG